MELSARMELLLQLQEEVLVHIMVVLSDGFINNQHLQVHRHHLAILIQGHHPLVLLPTDGVKDTVDIIVAPLTLQNLIQNLCLDLCGMV